MFSFVNMCNLQYEPYLYNKNMAMRVTLGGFNTKTVSFLVLSFSPVLCTESIWLWPILS